MRTTSPKRFASGFTLIEMIITIVLIGIVAFLVAGFLRFPIQNYVDTNRRTELSTTIARVQTTIDRDVARALPGSIRVLNTSAEMVPTIQNTSYCSFGDASAAAATLSVSGGTIVTVPCKDPLDVTTATDSSFQPLGPPLVFSAGEVPAQILMVVGNNGETGSDVYAGANARVTGQVNSNTVNFTATANPITAESPSGTVYFVRQPVSYVCSIATGELLLFRNYPFTAAQAEQPAGATKSVLATGLTACNMQLTKVDFANAVLTIRLTFKLDGGNQQVVLQSLVNNSP